MVIVGVLALLGSVAAHEIIQVEKITENKKTGSANTDRIVKVEEAIKKIPATNERLAGIEGKMDLLLEHIGIPKK